jgi:hypothetical protein
MASLNRIMLRFQHAFWADGTYTFGFLPTIFSENGEEEWATEPTFSVAVVAAYEDREIVGGGAVLTFMIGGDSGAEILTSVPPLILNLLPISDHPASRHSHSSTISRVMRLLRHTFGPSVPDPTSYAISNWTSEPFALGVYAYLPVNTSVHTDVPALVQPLADKAGVERLFWAGEATMQGASRGTTHGAFLSGVREAARMIGREEEVEKVLRADEDDLEREGRGMAMEGRAKGSARQGITVNDWFGGENEGLYRREILCGEYEADEFKLVVQDY